MTVRRRRLVAACALLLLAAAHDQRPAAPLSTRWIDDPAKPSLALAQPIRGVREPSDLLLIGGALYTVGDSSSLISRLDNAAPDGWITEKEHARPVGLPALPDLEAMAPLPDGSVLVASETEGLIYVLRPFPERVCAVWRTGIDGACLFGRANCGIEAMSVLPDGRLFVGREREPRGAWLFDTPPRPCEDAKLTGQTALALPDELGPDLSAATWDPVSGHLFLVGRSRQVVLEAALPPARAAGSDPLPLKILGSFRYAGTEDSLRYAGFGFPQAEGIAIEPDGTLRLILDNNDRVLTQRGVRAAALLTFRPGH